MLLYCCVGNFILWDWSMAVMGQYIRQAHFTTKPHFTAKFFAFALFVHGYSFQLTALSSNSFNMQNFPFYNFKTRLGGEIFLSDINMHTGCLVNCVLLHNPLNLKVAY